MKKSELTEMFNKWLATIPDDETEVETETAGETETVETVENTVETETTGETETVLSTEIATRKETVTENGERKLEEKRIYVDSSGDYYYR